MRIATRRRLSIVEYLSLLAIIVIIAKWGFVSGILIGVVIGCATFALSAARIESIKFSFNGTEYRSSLDRSRDDQALLTEHEIPASQGVYNFTETDRYGLDDRARTTRGHKDRRLGTQWLGDALERRFHGNLYGLARRGDLYRVGHEHGRNDCQHPNGEPRRQRTQPHPTRNTQ